MKKTNTNPTAHLFICCRSRDNGKACCSSKGAETLVTELKAWVKSEGLKKQIRVSRSSCLDHCEKGIAAVLYPQNQWFTDIATTDIESLKDLLKSKISEA